MPVISRFNLRRAFQAAMPHYQGFIGFKSKVTPFTKEQAVAMTGCTAKFFRGHARFFSRTIVSTMLI
jgi:hypothetical protein